MLSDIDLKDWIEQPSIPLYDVPEHVRRDYRRKWVRSIRNLGDKWLFAKHIQRKDAQQS